MLLSSNTLKLSSNTFKLNEYININCYSNENNVHSKIADDFSAFTKKVKVMLKSLLTHLFYTDT